jgi:hypothetical protein
MQIGHASQGLNTDTYFRELRANEYLRVAFLIYSKSAKSKLNKSETVFKVKGK